jgi:hypothetical protein
MASHPKDWLRQKISCFQQLACLEKLAYLEAMLAK